MILIVLIGEAVLLLPGVYLLLLTVASFFHRRDAGTERDACTRFAILVPAHNEELLLPSLLGSLERVDYPAGLFDIYVAADNCSDVTAAIARRHGAIVYERDVPALRGKPYALRWLLERVRGLDEEYDAYVFLDADTVVSSNILRVIDGRFQSGSNVVQVHYAVSNPTESSAAALRFIGFQLMNYVRPLGKKALGLSCGLFGTGMGFKRDILNSHGWDAFTLTEDAEYALKLMARGVRVDFAPEAKVLSPMPASLSDARTQNLRWERGRLIMAWRYGLRFVLTGILEQNPSKLSAGMDQLIPPLSVPCLAAGLLLVVSFISGKPGLIGLGLAVNVCLAGHVLLGMRSARVPMRLYLVFIFAPWLLVWKTLIYLQSLVPGEIHWIRTERPR